MPKFTAELLDYAHSLKNIDINLKDRKTIRGLSIDAEETQDIDDTIWVVKNGDTYICDISIADTASLIQADSPIFEIASKNIVTKYLRNYSIPMIPNVLSKDLLSLQCNSSRPAINFHIELDALLNVVHFEISERKIRNAAKLSYEKVARMLLDNSDDSQTLEVLLNAYELALKLSTKRRLMGALAYFDEAKGIYTDEEGNIKSFANKDIALAYLIVQEMMVLANSETAKYFAEKDIPFVFRNHTVKGNIPDREEVHSQLVNALQNKSMFSSFVSRMSIWQNRAQYEVSLKGHYALNLPAYAHVTSPLRRFADMINHVIIKAHLQGKELPISVEHLNEYCQNINQFMLKQQEDKHEHFKKMAQTQISENLLSYDSNALADMDAKEFKIIIKNLREAHNIKSRLIDEIQRRVEQASLAAIDIYYILFESRWLDNKTDFKTLLFESIPTRQGLSTEILTLLQGQGKIVGYDDVTGEDGIFFTNYTVIETNEGKFLTSGSIEKDHSKKEVLNRSRTSSLLAYLKDEAIETEKPEKNIEKHPIPAAPIKVPKITKQQSSKFSNPIGLIQEIIAKRNDIGFGGYEFLTISDNPPLFRCTLEIHYNGEVIRYKGEGSNKKDAKFEAAHQAAEEFEQYKVSKEDSKLDQLRAMIDAGLALSAVNFICILQKVAMPTYTIEELAQVPTPQFSCNAYLKLKDREFYIHNLASGKKEAKILVAEELLREILRDFPEVLGEDNP